MNEHKDPAATDYQSDPARTPGLGWVGEGGASHLGPATHLRSAHQSDAESDQESDETDGSSEQSEG